MVPTHLKTLPTVGTCTITSSSLASKHFTLNPLPKSDTFWSEQTDFPQVQSITSPGKPVIDSEPGISLTAAIQLFTGQQVTEQTALLSS